MVPAITLGTIWTFNNLNIVWLVSNAGEPSDQTHLLVSFVYKAAFNFYRYGYGAALSMVIFFILLVFSLIFMRKSKATRERLFLIGAYRMVRSKSGNRRPRDGQLRGAGALFAHRALSRSGRSSISPSGPADRLLSTSLELIPENASLDNYVALFTERPFLLWLGNSTFVAVVVTLTGVVAGLDVRAMRSRAIRFIGQEDSAC